MRKRLELAAAAILRIELPVVMLATVVKSATKNDSRITRVGRFIRKTRIDELPQVWNVIKGEMSMVGPRPERPQFIQKLQQQIPFYRTRLAAKPGLTGWAQVSYGYGATVEDEPVSI